MEALKVTVDLKTKAVSPETIVVEAISPETIVAEAIVVEAIAVEAIAGGSVYYITEHITLGYKTGKLRSSAIMTHNFSTPMRKDKN